MLRFILVVCLMVIAATSQVFAQVSSDVNFEDIIQTALDNRSIAMGRTVTATAKGSSTIFSNPSMLATFSKPQVQVGGRLFFGTTTVETYEEDDDGADARYAPFPDRTYLALALPYQPSNTEIKLAFGIGYQRNEGMKLEEEEVNFWGSEIRRTSTIGRGALSTLTPGIALNLQDKYFVGVALNRTIGKIINTTKDKSSDALEQRDFEINQSASFLSIGALSKLTPELSIGLMYRPTFEWEWENLVEKYYEDGVLERSEKERINVKRTIPAVYGIGAEYKASPEWIVAGEIQSRQFSNFELRVDGVRTPVIVDDGFNYRVGAEYLGLTYPIRFGAFRDVILETDVGDATPKSLVGLTAGIGASGGGNFSWDASAFFGAWSKEVDDKGREYSENLIRVGISATYLFD